jgi:hypothetical protein
VHKLAATWEPVDAVVLTVDGRELARLHVPVCPRAGERIQVRVPSSDVVQLVLCWPGEAAEFKPGGEVHVAVEGDWISAQVGEPE